MEKMKKLTSPRATLLAIFVWILITGFASLLVGGSFCLVAIVFGLPDASCGIVALTSFVAVFVSVWIATVTMLRIVIAMEMNSDD
jgi:hypothetical protein